MISSGPNKNYTLPIILMYGFVAALTYDGVAKTLAGAPILVMPIFVGISLCVVLPFASLIGLKQELNKKNFIRPALFCIGQILVVGSLSLGSPFATFVSTAAGTLFAITLGKLFLREKLGIVSISGLLLTFFGIFVLKNTFSLPLLALVAGLIQGSAVFLARKRSLLGANNIDMAGASLLLLFCLSIPMSVLHYNFYPQEIKINWIAILIAGFGFAFLQTAYCYLSNKIEAWMLSLVGNTRIPASVLISAVLSTQEFSWRNMVVSLVIFSGILLSYKGMKLKQDSLETKSTL